MKYKIAISICALVLTSCSSGSSSNPDNDTDEATEIASETDPGTTTNASSGTSLFANGFRLARRTSELNVQGFERTTFTDYDYDFENSTITLSRTTSGDDAEPELSTLLIDDAGNLVGGSFSFSFGQITNGETDYELSYNATGMVVEYRESQFNITTFNYIDDQLDNIVHQLPGLVTTHRFEYDAQGQRIASTDGVTSVTTSYLYNAEGQLTSANEINQFGEELVSYEFAYDENGNHISTLTFTSIGTLVSTETFFYEASSETVFNHGIMRQAVEPFETTNAVYVR